TGRFATPPDDNEWYRRGYLCGMIRGDALLRRYEYPQPNGRTWAKHQFRLALVDLEALIRVKRYLAELDVATREFEFQVAHGNYKAMRAISAGSHASFHRINDLIAWPCKPDVDWHKGFLAGIFDAEGTHQGSVRICNTDREIIDRVVHSLARF